MINVIQIGSKQGEQKTYVTLSVEGSQELQALMIFLSTRAEPPKQDRRLRDRRVQASFRFHPLCRRLKARRVARNATAAWLDEAG